MRIHVLVGVALLVSGLVACDDSTSGLYDPLISEDTVTLAIPEVDPDVPTALDVAFSVSGIRGRFPELQADAEAWDIAIRRQGGELVFIPGGAFNPPMQNPIGGVSTAAVTRPLGKLFDELIEAPSFSELIADAAVPIQQGGVYVARSRTTLASYTGCENYAKMTPLSVNVDSGFVTLRIVGNSRCNDPRLATDG